jgi:hypothetical protein
MDIVNQEKVFILRGQYYKDEVTDKLKQATEYDVTTMQWFYYREVKTTVKDKFVKEILKRYTKLCSDRGAAEDNTYKSGLEVGAQIMYEKIKQQLHLESIMNQGKE